MHHRMTARFLLLPVALGFAPALFAAPKKGIVEGHVRDKNGEPLKNAMLKIFTGTHPADDATLVIPIITKSATGVVVATFPGGEGFMMENKHVTTTDKNGHYRLNVPAYTYGFEVSAPYTKDLGANAVAWERVSVVEGQTTTVDFSLNCSAQKDGGRQICEGQPIVSSSIKTSPGGVVVAAPTKK